MLPWVPDCLQQMQNYNLLQTIAIHREESALLLWHFSGEKLIIAASLALGLRSQGTHCLSQTDGILVISLYIIFNIILLVYDPESDRWNACYLTDPAPASGLQVASFVLPLIFRHPETWHWQVNMWHRGRTNNAGLWLVRLSNTASDWPRHGLQRDITTLGPSGQL